MKRGLIGFACLWTRTMWLMQNPGVHLFSNTNSICYFQKTLNCSGILNLDLNFRQTAVCWISQIFQKCLPPVIVHPLLISSCHWHRQSKLRHSTSDSLNLFLFLRTDLSNLETGKCAMMLHTSERWDNIDSLTGREANGNKRLRTINMTTWEEGGLR